MRTPVRTQREVVKFFLRDPTLPLREVARLTNIAAGTVGTIRDLLLASALTSAEADGLNDDAFVARLGSADKPTSPQKPEPDFEVIHAALVADSDMTLQLQWMEYQEQHPDGYHYSSFTQNYNRWRQRCIEPAMRQEHRMGEKVFFDFAGRTVRIEPYGAEPFDAQVFVAVLGASRYAYCRVVRTQSIPDWIDCVATTFTHFGGVPRYAVSDNLKSAVIRHVRGEDVVFNQAYRQCMIHYGCYPLATRVRKPKDKAHVELGVKLVRRWVLAVLRRQRFTSIDEANAAIEERMAFYRNRPFKKLPGTRAQLFETEKHKLQALPHEPYEYQEWLYSQRVPPDYHIAFEQVSYSVPHTLVGRVVDIRATKALVEFVFKNERVATWARSYTAGEVRTDPDHQPASHRAMSEGQPLALLAWAESVGYGLASFAKWHLLERHDPANGQRTMARVRYLAKLHGDKRINEVAGYLFGRKIKDLKTFEYVLKNQNDLSQPAYEPTDREPLHHANIRGKDYFGE